MAELVDALDSGSSELTLFGVRVPASAPFMTQHLRQTTPMGVCRPVGVSDRETGPLPPPNISEETTPLGPVIEAIGELLERVDHEEDWLKVPNVIVLLRNPVRVER